MKRKMESIRGSQYADALNYCAILKKMRVTFPRDKDS